MQPRACRRLAGRAGGRGTCSSQRSLGSRRREEEGGGGMGAPVAEACAQLSARKYRTVESRSPLSVLDVFGLDSPLEQPESAEPPRDALPGSYASYDQCIRRRCPPLVPTGKLRNHTKGFTRAFSRSSSLNDNKVHCMRRA